MGDQQRPALHAARWVAVLGHAAPGTSSSYGRVNRYYSVVSSSAAHPFKRGRLGTLGAQMKCEQQQEVCYQLHTGSARL
jgi:hypothetical protein